MSPNEPRTLNHQYYVHARPETVFRAFTEPAWLVRWLCDHAEIEVRTGGSYALGWTSGPTHRGTVVHVVPGKSITLSWAWEGVDLRGTELKLSVEPQDDGTVFQFDHSGFPREEKWTDLYAGAEWGWTYFAMNLKSVLEHGSDLRSTFDG